MKVVRVWFNHWFSAAYHMVNLIKEDKETDFYILGTNGNEENVMKVLCDYWEKEPDNLNDIEYVNYSLEFCLKHSIDIFVPRKKQLIIGKNMKKFEEIGTKILVEKDYDKLKELNNKKNTYEFFEKNNIGYIPEYYIADTWEKFCYGYERLSKKHIQICIKYIEDEGATSFRIIENTENAEDLLRIRKRLNVTIEEVKEFFNTNNIASEIIIMPYLEGPEISVDCLGTDKGLIAIPREKTYTRTEIIKENEEILKICNEFHKKYQLSCPYNIQFRYSNGVPYLLEINTRMSGGIQYSCLSTGVNIPNIAINKLLGVNKEWKLNLSKEQRISYIEMPVLI